MSVNLLKYKKYNLKDYDFLDLGCKNGGSINYCAKRFRTGRDKSDYAKGIGIDVDPEVVKRARAQGFDVIHKDILKLELEHKFRFVTALDFLEHLPDIHKVAEIIRQMSLLGTDFLFIRHPSFDDIEYLKALGLKLTWTDWPVHTAPAKSYDIAAILNSLGLKQYCFVYKNPIESSKSDQILPYNSPSGVLKYDTKLGKKKDIKFEKKIFSHIDIFVALRPLGPTEWNWITREG